MLLSLRMSLQRLAVSFDQPLQVLPVDRIVATFLKGQLPDRASERARKCTLNRRSYRNSQNLQEDLQHYLS